MVNVAVIGAGSWGTALALTSLRAGNKTVLIGRNEEICNEISYKRTNNKYLPNIFFAEKLEANTNLELLRDNEIIISAVPTNQLRVTLAEIKSFQNVKSTIVLSSKGIEQQTGKFPIQIAEELGFDKDQVAIISGPNFASEVAKNLPTATSISCANIETAKLLANSLNSLNFRCYYNDHVMATEIFGACKNVLAIACGIAKGLGFEENAIAAIITRGINEIRLILDSYNIPDVQIFGLAGIGDIVLTCKSEKSRNFSFGFNLAKNDNSKIDHNITVEGAYTAIILHKLALQSKLELPIHDAVHSAVTNNSLDNKGFLLDLVSQLLSRPIKCEY